MDDRTHSKLWATGLDMSPERKEFVWCHCNIPIEA
jgi:hypothetical protein